MKICKCIFWCITCWLIGVNPLQAQIQTVWALGDGEKVLKENLNHQSRQGNLTWDGEQIRLKGLYNEILAFQVIAEIGIQGSEGIYLEVEYPVHRTSGAVIGGSSLKYGSSGTVEIFSQHYLHVTQPTQPLWYYGSENAAPRQMTGWFPDALIPVEIRPSKGGLPISLPTAESPYNQGFWVDVHMPRDIEQFPPGTYTGSVSIYDGGEMITTIPLIIELLDAYMPEENASVVWMYGDSYEMYFPQLDENELTQMIKFEAKRHRVDMTGGFRANRSSFDEGLLDDYLLYLNGKAYTAGKGYRGPGQGVGEYLFPIGMYGANVLGHSAKEVQSQSDLWVDWFAKNAPEVKYFLYLIDEPRPEAYDWIKERAGWIKSHDGPGSRLPVFTTTGFNDTLDDYIDYWAAYDGVDLGKQDYVEGKGGEHWFYNGNRPRYGSIMLEGAAVDLRVNSWIMYKYDVPVHFIWHGTHWRHNHQGPKGHLHQNIYRRSITFMDDDMDFANGDGVYFYPGQMPFYPEESRGENQVFPSIRLKNIRRGQQDAIILKMVENKIGRQAVMKLIDEVVPRAMSEVNMDEEVPWSQKGDEYERIRIQLLELL